MARCTNHILAEKRHQSGMALVGVLWLCILLGALAAGMLGILRGDAISARGASDDAGAEGYADAAVYLTIGDLCDPKRASELALDGRERDVAFDGQHITVSVQDEAGKIDLNFASEDLLGLLLAEIGLSPMQSATIVEAVDDRRTQTSVYDTASSSDPAGPRLAFHAVDDLLSMRGMTQAIFDKIGGAVTVYSQSTMVIPAYAPEMVLRALPEIQASRIDEILQQRQSGTTGTQDAALEVLGTGRGGFTGHAFTLFAMAHVGRSSFTRKAVIRLTGNAAHPYWILDWRAP